MDLIQNLKTLWTRIYTEHKKEEEDHRHYREQQIKNRMQQETIRKQLRELNRQLQFLRRLRHRHHHHTDEQIELAAKIAALESEYNELHLKYHIKAFEGNGDADFNHYYRHIYLTRPFVLVFNLVLWFLLFRFGGVAAGLKIVILLFALMSSTGSLFEMFFLMRIKDRILKPVDSLQKGVEEIAKCNFDVTVSDDDAFEVSSLIAAFNGMAKKLLESEKLKAEYEENRKALVANISHDLKTPITSIQGYVEAITSGTVLPEEKLERYLTIIHNNAAYMNRLIDDLFLFSKLDMQKLDFHFEKISIRPFIEDMMMECSLDLEEKDIAFQFENELTQDYAVQLDAKRFYQVLRNIIDNAVKHGAGYALKIGAKLFESDGFVCVSITDNGPGMPKETLEHIFERFYRADSERTKDLSSTGLGLAIAKELIQAHGGTITVDSEINKGSCFTVMLPLKASQTEGE